jgi:O-antigen/teichoic acid export membrane protein
MTSGGVAAAPRSSAARGAALTLADQLVSSASNFLLGVLIARAGGADALGAFGIAFLVWLAVVGVHRAVVTEPMTVHGVACGVELREGLTASLVLGAAIGAVVAAVCGIVAFAGATVIGVLALAPWLPSLLAHDYCRAASFRRQQPERALIADVAFALVQAALTIGLFLLDVTNVAAFLAAWGLGATVGAAVGMVVTRIPPVRRGAITRLRTLWPRSRWFLAEFGTSFPADQGYLFLLPVLLGTAQFGLYRAGASLIGPVVVVFLAGGNVALPECVRRLRQGGVASLAHYTPRLTAAVLAVTVIYCGLVAAFAEPLLRLTFGPEFVGAAVITYLVAGQYVLMALGFGFGVAMKAANQMRHLWALRTFSAVVSISGVIALASWLGLPGAGLAGVVAGGSYTIGVSIGYWRMRRRLLAESTLGNAGGATERRTGRHGRGAGRHTARVGNRMNDG